MYSMAFRLKWKVIFFFMTKHIIGWLIPEIPKSIVKKCNMVLSFDSVTRITCDHSLNESYGAVLVCGTIYYAVQGGSNF